METTNVHPSTNTLHQSFLVRVVNPTCNPIHFLDLANFSVVGNIVLDSIRIDVCSKMAFLVNRHTVSTHIVSTRTRTGKQTKTNTRKHQRHVYRQTQTILRKKINTTTTMSEANCTETAPLEYLFVDKIIHTKTKSQEGYNYYQDFLSSKKFKLKSRKYNDKNYLLGPSNLNMECKCHGSCSVCNEPHAAHVDTMSADKDGHLFLHKSLCCTNEDCSNCDNELPSSYLSKRHTIFGEKIMDDMDNQEILQCWKMDPHVAMCGYCLTHMIKHASNRDEDGECIDAHRSYVNNLAEALSKRVYLERFADTRNYHLDNEAFERLDPSEWDSIVEPNKLEMAFQQVRFGLRSVTQIKAFKEYYDGDDTAEAVVEKHFGSADTHQIQYLQRPGKYIVVKMAEHCTFRSMYPRDVETYEEYVAELVNLCKANTKRSLSIRDKQTYNKGMFEGFIEERINALGGFGGEKSSAMVMLVLALNASKLYSGTYLELLEDCKVAAEGEDRLILFKGTVSEQAQSKMQHLEEENSRLREETEELRKQLEKANRRRLPKRRRKVPSQHEHLFQGSSSDSDSSDSSFEEDSDKENDFGGNASDLFD